MELQTEKTIINVLYIVLIVSTILSMVPESISQIVSLVMVMAVLIGAYFFRDREEPDSLLHNHMIYMIGTIWFGTTFVLLGLFVGGFLVYSQGDNSVFYSAIDQIMNGSINLDKDTIHNIFMDYMAVNKNLLIVSGIVSMGPPILYFVYRVANGYSRAMKGYRIAKPKSWL